MGGTRCAAHLQAALTRPFSGAYCSGMSTKNYNSFPEAPEAMRDLSGGLHLIRARQTLEQMLANERNVPAGASM